jgi:hypothetical protein
VFSVSERSERGGEDMRMIRNIISALEFHPATLVYPAWLYGTVESVEYDHTAMDDAWTKHFHGWQA